MRPYRALISIILALAFLLNAGLSAAVLQGAIQGASAPVAGVCDSGHSHQHESETSKHDHHDHSSTGGCAVVAHGHGPAAFLFESSVNPADSAPCKLNNTWTKQDHATRLNKVPLSIFQPPKVLEFVRA